MGQSQSNDELNHENVHELLKNGPEFFDAIADRVSMGSRTGSIKGTNVDSIMLSRIRHCEADTVEFDRVELISGKKYTYKVVGLQTTLHLHDIVRFEHENSSRSVL